MSRSSGIKLTKLQRHQLTQLSQTTKEACEYRSARGLLLRGEGQSASQVACQLGVTPKQVFVWWRHFRLEGISGLRVKKASGRPAKQKEQAKKLLPVLLKQDPQAVGYLKGRWVLRDLAKALANAGVTLHFTGVHRALKELDIKLIQPQLRAPGSIQKNYRKRREIARYRRIAPALLKKRS